MVPGLFGKIERKKKKEKKRTKTLMWITSSIGLPPSLYSLRLINKNQLNFIIILARLPFPALDVDEEFMVGRKK